MAEFVKEAEEEIVEPVIPKRESNHRSTVGQLHRCSVQVGRRQMRLDHDSDAVLFKFFDCEARTLFNSTEDRQCSHKCISNVAGVEFVFEPLLGCDPQNPSPPSK